MELSWLMRLRIAAAVAVGVILIGILAWPLAAPLEPFGVVSLVAGDISLGEAITLAVLAFSTGLLAYFLSWPYGRVIGILAVPAGLAIWAVRSGNIAGLLQLNPTFAYRQELFAALKWEPIFWLAIVAVGFGGVLIGQKIAGWKIEPAVNGEKSKPKLNIHLSAALTMVGTGLIVQFCIPVLARDVRMADPVLGSVVAQLAAGQIAFAVSVSFGIAAFAAKKFLNVSYIWSLITSALITAFANTIYVGQETLQILSQRWAAAFFPSPVLSILPVQMVAFGSLGSIVGYWMAVRYNYWREHA